MKIIFKINQASIANIGPIQAAESGKKSKYLSRRELESVTYR